MKKHQWSLLFSISILLLCLLAAEQLLFRSALVSLAVRSALELCAESLIPSLFCFMVLTTFLSSSGLSRLLSIPLLPLSRFLCLPAECGGILLMSMIGGYPVGVKALSDAYQNRQISEQLLQRMLCFCVAPAPSFVIVSVGSRLLDNTMAGVLLYCSQLLAALFLALLSSIGAASTGKMEIFRFLSKQERHSYSQALVEAVQFSSSNMLIMCGYVLLFSVFSALLSQLPLTETAQAFLSAFLEISAGSVAVCKLTHPLKLPILALFLSFGGLSVLFQLKNILKNAPCSMGRLFLSRVCHGALSAVFTAVLMQCFPQAAQSFSSASQPLPIADSHTPLLTGCLIAMLVIFLNSMGKENNSQNKSNRI